jgi:hypothetical protein
MKRIYYEKVGRRYKPVAEYDSEYLDSFPRGHHLVSVLPGCSSRRFNIDPAFAPMLAAGLHAEDAVARAVSKASELRPRQTPITPGQQKAWQKLSKEFGTEIATLEIASAREIAEEAVKALSMEVDRMMTNESVKQAYEHFMFLVKLTYEDKDQAQR